MRIEEFQPSPEVMTRALAVEAAAHALHAVQARGNVAEVINLTEYILTGTKPGSEVVEFLSGLATTEREGEGWLYDLHDLDEQPEGTVIEDQEGDHLVVTVRTGGAPRWAYVSGDLKGSGPMTSADVVNEGQGPWRRMEPTPL